MGFDYWLLTQAPTDGDTTLPRPADCAVTRLLLLVNVRTRTRSLTAELNHALAHRTVG